MHYVQKPLYQSLPPLTEDLDTLEERWRRERDPKRRARWPLFVLRKSGQVTSRGQAATPLAGPRPTVGPWLRHYRAGGIAASLTSKAAGAPAGQQTLPLAGCAPRPARLATASGLASEGELQPGRRAEYGLEGP
jgi:hypothetical protein